MRYSLFLIILFLVIKGFSQDLVARKTPLVESKIIYKDGTREKGMLWLASSAYKPRLKLGKKSKKIDFKKVDTIITNPNSEKERKFQYLNNNQNKFKIFVELIYKDEICIYIGLERNASDLFYSDFDRETMSEKFGRMKANHFLQHDINQTSILQLPNGNKISIPIGYSYYLDINKAVGLKQAPSYEYYILKNGTSKLVKAAKNKKFFLNIRKAS